MRRTADHRSATTGPSPSIAEWMRRLGVAAVIPPDRFTTDTLCRQIRRLTAGRGHQRSLELSSRIDSQADSERVCEFLEELSMRPSLKTEILRK